MPKALPLQPASRRCGLTNTLAGVSEPGRYVVEARCGAGKWIKRTLTLAQIDKAEGRFPEIDKNKKWAKEVFGEPGMTAELRVKVAPPIPGGGGAGGGAPSPLAGEGGGGGSGAGALEGFEWRVVSQPSGAAAAIGNPESPAGATFTGNLPGRYIVEAVCHLGVQPSPLTRGASRRGGTPLPPAGSQSSSLSGARSSARSGSQSSAAQGGAPAKPGRLQVFFNLAAACKIASFSATDGTHSAVDGNRAKEDPPVRLLVCRTRPEAKGKVTLTVALDPPLPVGVAVPQDLAIVEVRRSDGMQQFKPVTGQLTAEVPTDHVGRLLLRARCGANDADSFAIEIVVVEVDALFAIDGSDSSNEGWTFKSGQHARSPLSIPMVQSASVVLKARSFLAKESDFATLPGMFPPDEPHWQKVSGPSGHFASTGSDHATGNSLVYQDIQLSGEYRFRAQCGNDPKQALTITVFVGKVVAQINKTNAQEDDLTVLAPAQHEFNAVVQPLPVRVRVESTGGYYKFSLRTSRARLEGNTVIPENFQLASGAHADRTLIPVQVSSVVNDASLTLVNTGEVVEDFTVVDIRLPRVNAPNTPANMSPRITPYRDVNGGRMQYPFDVTVVPDLGTSGQKVRLVADNDGHSRNGEASIVVPGQLTPDITATTTVYLRGDLQTAPTYGYSARNRGKLRLVASVRGVETVQSNGFSVAAICSEIEMNTPRPVRGELVADEVGDLYFHWGAIYPYKYVSDSGLQPDLDEVWVSEQMLPQAGATGIFTDRPIETSGFMVATTSANLVDAHTFLVEYNQVTTTVARAAALLQNEIATKGNGIMSVEQYFVFADKRTGVTEGRPLLVPASGFFIIYEAEREQAGDFFIRVTKTSHANHGVSGGSNANNTTQNAHIP